jgi:hypothetical protein
MGVIRLPVDGRRGNFGERAALRDGRAIVGPLRPLQVLPNGTAGSAGYSAGCAGPIEFGQVIRGGESYCSVECSLGGDRPA